MKLEETDSGYYRCWLSETEQEQMTEHYNESPKKQLALRLMLFSGLRVGEVPNISKDSIETTDANYDLLTVVDGKYGTRQTMITPETRNQIRTIANTLELSQGDPIIDVAKRTVQNWVSQAAESIDHPHADDVSAHDMRRTWATRLVHSGLPSDIVMDWGGWDDHGTFRDHYWSLSDAQVAEQLERADII
ncbi:site-specific integrase [Halorubrum ejinorense]